MNLPLTAEDQNFSFHVNLKESRESIYWSQRELAQILQISRTKIIEWERNTVLPTIENQEKILLFVRNLPPKPKPELLPVFAD